VERAAATAFTRPAQTLVLGEQSIAAQLFAAIRLSSLIVEREKFQHLLPIRDIPFAPNAQFHFQPWGNGPGFLKMKDCQR